MTRERPGHDAGLGSTAAHGDLKALVLVRLSELGIMAWNAPTGLALPIGTLRPVRYGLPGQADVLAVLPPSGRSLAVEVKTGRSRLSKEQRRWARRFQEAGGLYLPVRSIEDLMVGLEEVRPWA